MSGPDTLLKTDVGVRHVYKTIGFSKIKCKKFPRSPFSLRLILTEEE